MTSPRNRDRRHHGERTVGLIGQRLSGGDRRSVGQADAVAADVVQRPELFDELFATLRSPDDVIRMRAADAIEKVSRTRPELLHPYRAQLLGEIARHPQQEIRWHVAQLLPRLRLSVAERKAAIEIVQRYLEDESGITRTNAMQALADFAERDVSLRPSVRASLAELTETGTPAMRSRGRKLLNHLNHLAD
jgi:hypothetical protein